MLRLWSSGDTGSVAPAGAPQQIPASSRICRGVRACCAAGFRAAAVGAKLIVRSRKTSQEA